MALQLLTIVLCLLLYIIYHKLNKAYKYWEVRDVIGPKPHFLLGNLWPVLTKTESIFTLTADVYDKYPDENFVGIYLGRTPALVLKNPEFIKRVLIGDFAAFADRGFGAANESISKNLFTEDGDNWKILRHRLTPLFTTGKLKRMMPLLDACAVQYLQHLESLTDQSREVRSLNMKYTLKCITSVAFGLDIDTFIDGKSEFVEMANKIFQPNPRRLLATIAEGIIPGITKKLGTKISRSDVSEFFFKLVSGIVEQRTKEPELRGDFMDLMIEMRLKGKVGRGSDIGVELEVTDTLITAQALLFYAAGFETSAGAMSFALYELALNPQIQQRCHEEVDRVLAKYKDQLPYEAVMDLQYLGMVLDETLRKHPVAALLQRRSVADYTFPGTSLHVSRGTKVLIPVLALHHDARYFPNPEKFDPERFSLLRRSDIQDGSYLPFGDGPRNCIGLRLARCMSLCGLARVLARFRVDPCARTVQHVRADPLQITLTAIGGLWIKLSRR